MYSHFWSWIIFLVSLVTMIHSRSISVSEQCNSDLDNFGLGKCLRPWLDTWELLRQHRSEAAELSFPILYYTREEVLALCDVYVETLDECLTQDVLRRCRKNPMVEFVQSHVGYVCGVKAIEVLAQFDCISSAVREQEECQAFIMGPAQPEAQAQICTQMPRFYYCLESTVFGKCGTKGLAILVQAIDGFGCDISELEDVPKPLPQLGSQNDFEDLTSETDISNEVPDYVSPQSSELDFNQISSKRIDDAQAIDSNALFPSLEKLGDRIVITDSISASHNPSSEDPEEIETTTFAITGGSEENSEEILVTIPKLPVDVSRSLQKIVPEDSDNQSEENESEVDPELVLSIPSLPKPIDVEDPMIATEEGGAQNEVTTVSRSPVSLETGDELFEIVTTPIVEETTIANTEEVEQLPEPAFKLGDSINTDKGPIVAVEPKTPTGPDRRVNSKGTPPDVLILQTTPAPSTLGTTGKVLLEEIEPEILQPEARCGVELEGELIKCFAPISHKWDEILSRKNTPPETIFPLYQYKTGDLHQLCDILQVTIDDCLTDAMLTECEDHPILAFVDSVLGFACGMKKTDFFLAYDCAWNVQRKRPECEKPILGQPKAGLLVEEKCIGIPEYFSCMERHLIKSCSTDSVDMLLRSIYHFGCDPTIIRPKKVFTSQQAVDKPQEEPVLEVFGSASLLDGPSKNNPLRVGVPPPGVPPPPVSDSGPVLSGFCTKRIRRKLKDCLNPLFFQWVRFRQEHGPSDNITFPLLNYKAPEVLELCDLYASAFIDCDFPLFDVCSQHDIVRFSHNHLGYICSPDHIEDFLSHFGCIQDVITKSEDECLVWIKGETTPGSDLDRCRGMPNFYECTRKNIALNCKPGALTQLQKVIRQYGCDVSEPKKTV